MKEILKDCQGLWDQRWHYSKKLTITELLRFEVSQVYEYVHPAPDLDNSHLVIKLPGPLALAPPEPVYGVIGTFFASSVPLMTVCAASLSTDCQV